MNKSNESNDLLYYRSELSSKIINGLLTTESLSNEVTEILYSPDYAKIRKVQDKLQHLYTVVKSLYNHMTQLNTTYENTKDSKVDLLIADRSTPMKMKSLLKIGSLIEGCESKQKRFSSYVENKIKSNKLINILRNESGIIKNVISYFQWFLDALRVFRGDANSSYSDETAREEFINQFNKKAQDYKKSSKYSDKQRSHLANLLDSSHFEFNVIDNLLSYGPSVSSSTIVKEIRKHAEKHVSSSTIVKEIMKHAEKQLASSFRKKRLSSIIRDSISIDDVFRHKFSPKEFDDFVETIVDYDGYDELRTEFTPKLFNGLPLKVHSHRGRGRPPSSLLDDIYDKGSIGLLLLKLNSQVNEFPTFKGVSLTESYDMAAKVMALKDYVKDTFNKNVRYCTSEIHNLFSKIKSVCGIRWLQKITQWYDEIRNDDVGMPDKNSHEGIKYRLFKKRIEHYKKAIAA